MGLRSLTDLDQHSQSEEKKIYIWLNISVRHGLIVEVDLGFSFLLFNVEDLGLAWGYVA